MAAVLRVAILRVVGPPGSGKTLLIVSLAEALRSRGHRVATVVERRPLGGDEIATVVVLSNGGRVTIEQPLPLDRLRALIPTIDPSVTIILAEGYDDDAGPDGAGSAFPAIALAPRGTRYAGDAIAVVATEEIAATFARSGPGETHGVVDLVERAVLVLPPREARPGWRRLFRWARR